MTGRASAPRRHRLRTALAAGVTATVAVSTIVLIDGGTGAAAADQPLAQSVGRFLDGSVGGNPLQQLADVKDARATNPGTTSAQNPLDATLLGQLELPLSGALNLPGGGVFTLGAVNQVAQAKSDGYAFGASGAVSNSGGISLGGTSQFPANATITLSTAALGSIGIPGLPGLPASNASAAALGKVEATIGAVSALALTKAGGDAATPKYQIAGLKLALSSPALGQLLAQLASASTALNALVGSILSKLGGLAGLAGLQQALEDCNITSGTLPSTLSLDGGAVVLDPSTGALTIDLAKLLQQLGLNLNALPANTDLLAYVLGNLGTILSKGLENVVNGIVDPISAFGSKCVNALPGPIGLAVGTLLKTLKQGQSKLESAVNQIAAKLSAAGAPALAGLTSNLAKVAAIGVNVESGPGKVADNTKHPFTSALQATPDQATPVVADQTLVRAIEIDVLGGQVASLALGNAAAGPSTPAVASPTPTPTTTPPTSTVPGTAVPTGIPAGQGQPAGGTPTLPLVLLVLGLLMAGGGAATWRLRTGKHSG